MAHRLVVQYGEPTDPAAFDQHYREMSDVDDLTPTT